MHDLPFNKFCTEIPVAFATTHAISLDFMHDSVSGFFSIGSWLSRSGMVRNLRSNAGSKSRNLQLVFRVFQLFLTSLIFCIRARSEWKVSTKGFKGSENDKRRTVLNRSASTLVRLSTLNNSILIWKVTV
jgi:hypothetical protein